MSEQEGAVVRQGQGLFPLKEKGKHMFGREAEVLIGRMDFVCGFQRDLITQSFFKKFSINLLR